MCVDRTGHYLYVVCDDSTLWTVDCERDSIAGVLEFNETPRWLTRSAAGNRLFLNTYGSRLLVYLDTLGMPAVRETEAMAHTQTGPSVLRGTSGLYCPEDAGLYDVDGRRVERTVGHRLSLEDGPPGVYFLRARGLTRKVVVAR